MLADGVVWLKCQPLTLFKFITGENVKDTPFKITDVLKDYRQLLTAAEDENKELKGMLGELVDMLDYAEESDGGTVFHPTYFSTCRVEHQMRFEKLFKKIKKVTRRIE